MLIYFLIFSIIFSGLFLYYVYYIAPRLNPVNKAEQYLKSNMLFEAILEYKKALDKNPDDFLVHARLADIYLMQNEIDLAVLHLEKIIELNKFNYEVERLDVEKKLARAYESRDETERSFQVYLDILKFFPVDPDALYNVAFIALGQEEFEIAQRYFEKLVKQMPNSFDVVFGAGICSYQNQRINDSSNYFKSAVSLNPSSDIANLAAAFAYQRKSDYRQAISYVQKVTSAHNEPDVLFIAKRLHGLLLVQSKKYEEAVKLFEDILEFVKKSELQDEYLMTLYDLGFACVKAEKTSQAYDYWNELYKQDKSYQSVQALVMILRREMELDYRNVREESEHTVDEHMEKWLAEGFPGDFLWNICGLKSDHAINIKGIVTTARISTGQSESQEFRVSSEINFENIQRFIELNVENFRILSSRLVVKLGYKVDQILQTYRENDGVDFLAVSPEKDKVLVWVRRWTKTRVGEIPLRNFAQAINDMKVKKGIFITSSELTPSAENSLSNLSKVIIIAPDELASLLEGMI
jgi:tetratricopeptide (TPR) repeat protein